MTDWTAIIAADFTVPADARLQDLVEELLEALGSPDPSLRDEQAYPVLSTWIVTGRLDSELAAVGGHVTGLFADPRTQARTFAALILAAAIHRDTAAAVLDPAVILRWRDDFAAWWLAETDLRGWDDELGWLHAIAHGADVAGEFGLSPGLDERDLAKLLDLISARLLAPSRYLFAHQEDDRVALALATILTRPELAPTTAMSWLRPVRDYFEAAGPGPVPIPAANTMRTLRSLYLMTDRGFRPDPGSSEHLATRHRAELLTEIAGLLSLAFPHQL